MKLHFINPVRPRCGVHQYGLRLLSLLSQSGCFEFNGHPDVVLYNWHPIIDPTCSALAQFPEAKKVIIYHDGTIPVPCDLVLFSDPSAPSHDNWVHIGRPLPDWHPTPMNLPDRPRIGISGFCGAWATDAVNVLRGCPPLDIRLHLPHSDWCDADGNQARAVAEMVTALAGGVHRVQVTHEFLTEVELLSWMSDNHANCFIRNNVPSVGVSSALDNALAVRRPIIINRCPMFRHLFATTPSICVEDTPPFDIIRNGVFPLLPHYDRNHRVTVRHELEQALLSLQR